MYHALRHSSSIVGTYPTNMCIHVHKKTCSRIFIAVLFIVAPNWELLKSPLTIEYINKLYYGIFHNNENE